MDELVVQGDIGSRIFTLRGKEVTLDRDLAKLYKVETRTLKQAVRRNIERLPSDLMFEITNKEIEFMVSQSVILSKKHLGGASPFVFTEQGVYMLATILKSDVVIDVNIAIMKTFIKLREFSKHYNTLAKRIMQVKKKSDKKYKELKNAFDELVQSSKVVESKTIGFIK